VQKLELTLLRMSLAERTDGGTFCFLNGWWYFFQYADFEIEDITRIVRPYTVERIYFFLK
jgi:hypothetical protein